MVFKVAIYCETPKMLSEDFPQVVSVLQREFEKILRKEDFSLKMTNTETKKKTPVDIKVLTLKEAMRTLGSPDL